MVNLENWLKLVESHGLVSVARLKFRCREVFKDVLLTGSTMLEIGSGPGLFCLWAAMHGATRVVGLEPEAEGCSPGSSQIFRDLIKITAVENIECVSQRLQDFNPGGERFDVVLSHNSVEHLDEDAVVSLDRAQAARDVYIGLFRKVGAMMRRGGRFIIYNVGRSNLWPHVFNGWSPLAPSIEWHKHHDPIVWRRLLEASGFGDFHVSWQRFYSLRHLGPIASNSISAFLLTPVFRLKATYLGMR